MPPEARSQMQQATLDLGSWAELELAGNPLLYVHLRESYNTKQHKPHQNVIRCQLFLVLERLNVNLCQHRADYESYERVLTDIVVQTRAVAPQRQRGQVNAGQLVVEALPQPHQPRRRGLANVRQTTKRIVPLRVWKSFRTLYQTAILRSVTN